MKDLLVLLDINNRDISLFIWFLIIFLWLIRNEAIRKSFANVIKVLLERVIFIPLSILIIYIAFLIYLLNSLNVWDIGNLKDSIYWLFGTGLVFFVNINQIREEGYIIQAIIDGLKVAVFVEFIVNLYVFELWAELILVPLLLFLGGLMGYASAYKKYEKVENLIRKLLIIIGFVILLFVVVSIVKDFRGFFSTESIRDFVIPILLSIGYIPFLYFFGLFILYESIFNRIDIFSDNRKISFHAKVKTFFSFGFNLSSVRSWSHGMGILKLNNKEDIKSAIRIFKSKGA